jgi:acetyl esterase
MTMHPQTKAYLDYTAANNPMSADATLVERRADSADYLKYAGPQSA